MSTALDIDNDNPTPPAGDPNGAPPSDPPADPSASGGDNPPAGSGDNPPADPPAPGFGENWRKDLAGDDEKLAKLLGRYSTPADMAKALAEANQKIRSGELGKQLGDDASDEEIAEWREANGIPKSADEYSLDLEEGLVIGDEDKPILDSFLEAMHGENASQSQITAGLNAFFKARDMEMNAIEEKDNTDRGSALQSLRDEWGPDYQSNQNALRSLVNQVPESVRESFANARLADGTALMNSPEMLMFLSDLSRKTNPAAAVVPNSNNPIQAISDEKARIEKLMKAGSDEYWKDEKMQSRYRELISAEENF